MAKKEKEVPIELTFEVHGNNNGKLEMLRKSLEEVSVKHLKKFIRKTVAVELITFLILSFTMTLWFLNGLNASTQEDALIWGTISGMLFGLLVATVQHYLSRIKVLVAYNEGQDHTTVQVMQQVVAQLDREIVKLDELKRTKPN